MTSDRYEVRWCWVTFFFLTLQYKKNFGRISNVVEKRNGRPHKTETKIKHSVLWNFIVNLSEFIQCLMGSPTGKKSWWCVWGRRGARLREQRVEHQTHKIVEKRTFSIRLKVRYASFVLNELFPCNKLVSLHTFFFYILDEEVGGGGRGWTFEIEIKEKKCLDLRKNKTIWLQITSSGRVNYFGLVLLWVRQHVVGRCGPGGIRLRPSTDGSQYFLYLFQVFCCLAS